MGWKCVELDEMRLGLRFVGGQAEIAASVGLRAEIRDREEQAEWGLRVLGAGFEFTTCDARE
jgi:hypothetical protein